MSRKDWAQGKYPALKNPQKYVGLKTPTFRSSWEWVVMNFFDTSPSVLQWSSESVKIPYRHPFTGKQTIYVPDFLVFYQDKNGNKRAELVEVKPSNQASLAEAGNSRGAKETVAVNLVKWAAARAWCAKQNITFRVITEKEIFRQSGKNNK